MKKALGIALIGLTLLYGCAPGAASATALQMPNKPSPAAAVSAAAASPSPSGPQPSASDAETTASAAPVPAAERTPDPASEMLVTGTVTAVLDNAAIEVKADSLSQSIIITMLNRAEYADGVSKKFRQGNHVRIITSNKFAKTLPERVTAVLVLENSEE